MTDLLVSSMVFGALVASAGLGTWVGWWYAPLVRGLNGIVPMWLGPAQLCFGAALALTAGSVLARASTGHDTLVSWAVVIGVQTLPCLVGGVLDREHREFPEDRTGRPRRRLARAVLNYLLTHQEPVGGPVWRRPEP